jgi:Protein of unknown function (DUF3551)
MEVLMRGAILAILSVGAVLWAAPSQAQTYDPRYPVCLQVYTGSFVDYYFECGYQTMAQCQMSASGRAAQCVVNPYYGGRTAAPGRHYKRSHHH